MSGRLPEAVDVLVVGAGPAGSMAAREAARSGARTLLIERKSRIGVPVRCGEYVPRMLLMEIDAPGGWVEQETPELVLHLPDGSTVARNAPGAVLDRSRLDPALAHMAVHEGATLLLGCSFRGIGEDGSVDVSGASPGSVRPRVIVGADGPCSRVARSAGLSTPELVLAMQQVVALRRRVVNAHVYFLRSLRQGYAWLFPKGDRANLGVAVAWRRPDLARRELGGLRDELIRGGVMEDRPALSRCWGLVPASGPAASTAAGNVLLAGDAAGQVDPLTGAGLTGALRCGGIAGRMAARHALGRSPALEYERRWRSVMEGFFSRSLARREIMRSMWDEDPDAGVRAAWIERSPERKPHVRTS